MLKPVQIERMRVMDTIGIHPSIKIREIATSAISIEYAVDAMATESSHHYLSLEMRVEVGFVVE